MENTEKKSDQEVLNEFAIKYSAETKKIEARENLLVGNFNENGEYKILDIIVKELVSLQKIIEFKDEKEYKATAVISKVKLNFVVIIEDLPDNKKLATLKLVENLVVAKIYKSTITTPLSKFEDFNTDNFLYKVRKAFHLISKDEQSGKVDIKDYVSPPIELYTELKKKQDYFSKLMLEREVIENKYITNIFNILRKTEKGNSILKKFVGIVKANQLDKNTANKFMVFRQILDRIIEEETTQNTFDIKDQIKIKEARTIYLQEIKTAEKKFEKEQDSILGKSSLKPKAPSKPAMSKSSGGGGGDSGGGSKSKGGGGGGKSGGDSGKSDKAKAKDDGLFGEKFFEGLKDKKTATEKSENEKPQEKKAKPQAKQKQAENKADLTIEEKLAELDKMIIDIDKQENLLSKETELTTALEQTEEKTITEPNKDIGTQSINVEESKVEIPKKFEDLKKISLFEQEKIQ